MGILEIAIIGALLSGVVQIIKKKWGTDGNTTKMITVGLALVMGAAIYFLQDTAFWANFLGVLAASSTVYAFLLKK